MNITAFIGIIIVGILTAIGVARSHLPAKVKVGANPTSGVTITTPPSQKENIQGTENTNPSTPTPSTGKTFSSLNLGDFMYPGASQTSKSDSSVTLSSTDSPSTISSWYQQKVNTLQMGAKSVINTNTNGNVNTVIDVAGNGQEVKITIAKNSGDANVKITVDISANNSNSVHNSVDSSGSTNTNSYNHAEIHNNVNTSTDTSNTY